MNDQATVSDQSFDNIQAILFPDLIKETRIFNSFAEIFSKSQKDGYIDQVYATFDSIIFKEKIFALQRKIKRIKKIASRKSKT